MRRYDRCPNGAGEAPASLHAAALLLLLLSLSLLLLPPLLLLLLLLLLRDILHRVSAAGCGFDFATARGICSQHTIQNRAKRRYGRCTNGANGTRTSSLLCSLTYICKCLCITNLRTYNLLEGGSQPPSLYLHCMMNVGVLITKSSI